MTKSANPQFDQINAAAAKQMSEMTQMMQQTMNAFMRSGQIMSQNASEMNQSAMELLQSMGEQNSTAMRDMMGAKSLDDMATRQTEMAQKNLESWMSLMGQVTEAGIRTAMEAGEPISKQMSETVSKAGNKTTTKAA